MCDFRYFDDDIQQKCCPDQPICDLCFRADRETGFREICEMVHAIALKNCPKGKPKKVKIESNLPVGVNSAYEFTLTSTVDDPYYLRESFSKIVNSAMFEVSAWEACIELTKNGMPHIHGIVYSKRKYLDGTKIKTKFKYRYEFKRVKMMTNYLNYIKKEDGNKVIQDYCTKKGIPQFWKSDDAARKTYEPKDFIAQGETQEVP